MINAFSSAPRRAVAALLLGGLLALCGCSTAPKKEVPVKKYQLRGEIVRLEPQRQIAVIKHEKIEGWMEAMTMEFPVRDKAEFSSLADGKKIRATVFVQDLDYWLGEIQADQ